MSELTALLERIHAGDARATGELFDRVHDELRRMAAAQVRDDAGAYSPTELVHEAYLRLFPGPPPAYADRAMFLLTRTQAARCEVAEDVKSLVAKMVKESIKPRP